MTQAHRLHRCGNCKHHIFDPQEGKSVCVSKDSDNFTGYTEYDDHCEKWEAKKWAVV